MHCYLIWFSHHNDYHTFQNCELEALEECCNDCADLHTYRRCVVTDTRQHLLPSAADIQLSLASWNGLSSASPSDDANLPAASTGAAQVVYGGVAAYALFPSEALARRVVKRSLLIRHIVEVWGEGSDLNSVADRLKDTKAIDNLFKQYINAHSTFAFNVETHGKHVDNESQVEKMNKFSFLFEGTEKANLKNPDTTLFIGEIWNEQQQLNRTFFGRIVASRGKGPFYWMRYNLSDRPVLGPTSLDNALAFLMVNQAGVTRGDVVLDPFVGSGGLLIAASHFGAQCIGADIDIRVLKGYGVAYHNDDEQREKSRRLGRKPKHDRSATTAAPVAAAVSSPEDRGCTDVFQNFTHYKLPTPDIIRGDTSSNSRWLRSSSRPMVNAVITDPPYGIRASVRQSEDAAVDSGASAKVGTVTTSAEAVIKDLLELSSRVLVVGGHLVFLLPVTMEGARADFEDVVCHPDFELVSHSVQLLPACRARVLVTLRRREAKST